MKVLIIKLTSMGDLMHALPALTDAASIYPDIEFDWVVDQTFAEVPLWHPNVKRVIKTAHRQWRKQPITAYRDGRLKQFYRDLNAQQYDVVIDMQSNIKSAVVSWLHKGDVHGLDKHCCREKPAHWAYKYQHHVELKQHSIEKLRQLMAEALQYKKPTSPANYGVDLAQYELPALDIDLSDKYLLFVHNASKDNKQWPIGQWRELVAIAVEAGYSVLLPCGSDDEYQRAQRIAKVSEQAFALPRVSLNAMAALTHHAQGAVSNDTGLAHLVAVADKPGITLYGPTDPKLIGTYGDKQEHIVSEYDGQPCYRGNCLHHDDKQQTDSVCMENINAQYVWNRLEHNLAAQ